MSSDAEDSVVSSGRAGLAVEVLETLVNRAYDRAKRCVGGVLLLQSGLFAAAVLAVFWPACTLTYPWLAFPVALFGAWVSTRAAAFKGMAESAKRQHEYVASFGVKPSGVQLADLRQNLKDELSPEAADLLKLGITYASGERHGPRRALENLCESAWFSKHLASRCVYWVAGTFTVTLAVGISLLLYSSAKMSGTEAGTAAAKGVAATFMFLISVGSIRSLAGYAKLSGKAEKVDAEASRMLASDEPSMFEAQRLLMEYQVARASAPLIPTWLWRIHRKAMNEDYTLRNSKA